jgi:creatinine amidohydrolase
MYLPTSTTAEEAARAARVAVLPVGSFEQHGAHLPLSTDSIVAGTIAQSVAEAYDLLLLPPVAFGCSHEHAKWPGTVSIRASTLMAIVNDIAASLEASGVRGLVVVNGHGGNYALANAVQEANVRGPRMALFPSRSDWERAREKAGLVSSSHDDMHAGEVETSLLLHASPQSVRPGFEGADHVAERPHLLTLGMDAYTTTGVIGRPSLGTADKGRAVLESLTSDFAAALALLSGADAAEDGDSTPERGAP